MVAAVLNQLFRVLNNLWLPEITKSNYGLPKHSSLQLPITLVRGILQHKSAVFSKIQKTLCKVHTARLPTCLGALECVWGIWSHVPALGSTLLGGGVSGEGSTHRSVPKTKTDPSTDDLGIIEAKVDRILKISWPPSIPSALQPVGDEARCTETKPGWSREWPWSMETVTVPTQTARLHAMHYCLMK